MDKVNGRYPEQKVDKKGEEFQQLLREANVSKYHAWFMTLVNKMRKD